MARLEFNGNAFHEGQAYSLQELTETVHEIGEKGQSQWALFASVFVRMQDLGLTLLDLERCLKYGDVTEYFVNQSRVEMRLHLSHNAGDLAGYEPVVWLSTFGHLCFADIRDGSEGRQT